MTLFPEGSPRVYATPPGVDFAAALARGLKARLGDGAPEAVARVRLILNTRRAARAATAAFEAEAGAAAFLPRIGTLDDLDDPALAPAEALALPPAVDRLRRTLLLTRLVARYLAVAEDAPPPSAAPALADALAGLLDEMRREGAPLDALAETAPPEHAEHWSRLLPFLDVIRRALPAWLAEEDALDGEERRRRLVEAIAAEWAARPPAEPVILAGSTGSVGTTALLMRAVAAAPQGALVLPGFDPAAARAVWTGIGETHPFAGMKRLLDGLGLPPEAVAPWAEADAAGAPRRRLVLEALRPAPATDGWLAARAALGAEAEAATSGLTLVEAPDPRREAAAIALAMREALETPGRRVALVTPDRTLARRVTAALRRWEIEPDDSGGRPLALTPPGLFLTLLASVAFDPFDAVSLLALLKHPLTRAGEGRGPFLMEARRFETGVLRRRPEIETVAAARDAWARFLAEGADEDDPLVDEAAPEAEAPSPLGETLAALAALEATTERTLGGLAAAHLDLAAALAPPLWEKEAGRAALAAAEALRAAAEVYGDCEPRDYPALLSSALKGEAREEAFRPDARAAIWGTLEARTQSADLVILGGLNEGVWPPAPGADPWLSREMRAALGLPPAERRAGLAAHDFLVSASGRDVILTRAAKAEGSPTTASRLLLRLTTLLAGVAPEALGAIRDRGARLLAMVDPLAQGPGAAAPERDRRPAPRPPVEARPRRLVATEVETLIRDPYAVYARRVLDLRALDPIGRDLDARDRGIALHEIMAAFARDAGRDPEAAFDAALAGVETLHAPEALRRLWRARLERLRATLLKEEAARRALGAPAGLEAMGERHERARRFTLFARADRIDRRRDGTLAIYDYKTGNIPTDKQIDAFAKQLPLTAAVAEAGGFTDIEGAPVTELAHISLSGGKGGGGTLAVKAAPSALAAETWEKLLELVAEYDRAETGYRSRARMMKASDRSDYDHLARVGAWSADES